MDAPVFGTTGKGEAVHRVALSGGGLRAHAIGWGAALQDLFIEGHDAPLVLGFDAFDDYPAYSRFFGATAGRCANRIRDGHFSIDGESFQADRNFLGKHTLHGGAEGIGKRVWRIAEQGGDHVTFRLTDPDGAMGFPGTMELSCSYRLKPPATLEIVMTGGTDQPTLCNLAHHSYFNLDDGGAGACLDHRVMIPAAAYLPVDAELIPTGEVLPVEGTMFDFRAARTMREEIDGAQFGYDHNFCLSAARGELHRMAWVQAARSGIEMEVWSTEPGLQFFAGQKQAIAVPGLGGRSYPPFAGFCMEPQVWPDSPNRPYFPQAVLRPGETYRQVTEYRFRDGEMAG